MGGRALVPDLDSVGVADVAAADVAAAAAAAGVDGEVASGGPALAC